MKFLKNGTSSLHEQNSTMSDQSLFRDQPVDPSTRIDPSDSNTWPADEQVCFCAVFNALATAMDVEQVWVCFVGVWCETSLCWIMYDSLPLANVKVGGRSIPAFILQTLYWCPSKSITASEFAKLTSTFEP